MRYTVIFLVTLMLSSFYSPVVGQAAPGVSASNSILMEQSSGRILYEKQAHVQRPIASITKIMTAIIAIESGKLNETVTVSNRAVNAVGSSIYLEEREEILVKDLVYGLMLRSGNDAAVAISEHIGGSVEGFVQLMNHKTDWIGMTNTSFDNPHGLDADNHYSTAYDMAILMRYAMDNDIFREITSTKVYKSDDRAYVWRNKNKLLTGLYDYSNGGKTGYTSVAGRTLVSSARKNDMELIAVTLNGPDDWRDHIGMFEWGFDSYDMTTIDSQGQINYRIKDTENQVTGYLHRDINLPLAENEQAQLQSQSFLLNDTNAEDDVIGRTIYFVDSVPVTEVPIYARQKRSDGILSDIVTMYNQIIGFDRSG